MKNFVTLFDINFINHGIALYESLKKTTNDFILYIFCFDDATFDIINKIKQDSDKGIIPIRLKDLENQYCDLKNVKKERSAGEYCWTSTPFVIKYCLEFLEVDAVTYLDSDLYFLKSPSNIIELLPKDKNIIITKHNYSDEFITLSSKQSGVFCVQFMYFNKEKSSIEILNQWANECIEWCYAYYDQENDRFGDQKYLDKWVNYENVFIPDNVSFAAGPWNINNITINGNYKDVVFYHFHDLKIRKNMVFDLKKLLIYPKNETFIKLYKEFIINLLKINTKLNKKYSLQRIKCANIYKIIIPIILRLENNRVVSKILKIFKA